LRKKFVRTKSLKHAFLKLLRKTNLQFLISARANDFVTMSLATDNVKHISNINKWNVKNITLASLIVGTLLVTEGGFGILIGVSYFHLELGQLSTFVMTMLIFTSLLRAFIVKEKSLLVFTPRQGTSYIHCDSPDRIRTARHVRRNYTLTHVA